MVEDGKLNYKQSVITKFGYFSGTLLDACGSLMVHRFGKLMAIIIVEIGLKIEIEFSVIPTNATLKTPVCRDAEKL